MLTRSPTSRRIRLTISLSITFILLLCLTFSILERYKSYHEHGGIVSSANMTDVRMKPTKAFERPLTDEELLPVPPYWVNITAAGSKWLNFKQVRFIEKLDYSSEKVKFKRFNGETSNRKNLDNSNNLQNNQKHFNNKQPKIGFLNGKTALKSKKKSVHNFDYFDIRKCPLCLHKNGDNTFVSSPNDPQSNSTPRDLILTMMTLMSMNAITYIRTLRSTGCKATVVVLVDDIFHEKLTEYEEDVMKNCGMIMINIGKLLPPYDKHIYESRHVLFYAFLRKYRYSFDRVMMIDMADTVFQLDPFTTDFDSTTMVFTTEGYFNNNDPHNNTKWIKIADPMYNVHPSFYDDKIVINGGCFYGSMDGILYFYSIYLKLPCYNNFEIETIDQGYMNYLYHNGFFSHNGLNISLTFPGDYIVSARGHRFDPSPNQDGRFFMQDTINPPGLIHQYNRDRNVLEGVKKICPALPGDQHPFPFFKA
ncbi:hypothetical protein TRFO_26681 [Tritrichomonas foetus]|uniref:Nucleotide-diphospho-sugar transferase domain-containing protein n=1 Tax=Tritrichomonas foetus TaxID=1144522 RepID=A0A1J4K7Y2_9EUKA|nr:hypothetical protein TRFO_26681 [Tritrichomonas foetus]|eukprot:OHT05541.1 hypothetical protein TRFO_26681 [Tritrichomonas foetus]